MQPTLFVVLAMFTASATAQTTATLYTDTTMVVRANGVTRQWLPNQRLDPYGGTLAAATIGAMARTHILWQGAANGGFTYTHIEDMQADASKAASVGSHRTRLRMSSPMPVTGHIIVDWQPYVNRGNGSVTVRVDVTGNGYPDFTGTMASPGHAEYLVLLDSSGRTIRTTTEGALNPTTSFGFTQGTLTVTWQPLPPCTFGELGPGCGPTLTALNSLDGNVDVVLDGAPPAPDGRAALFLGFNPLSFQIPGTDCFLHTDIAIVANLNVDGAGRATIRVPLRVRPVVFHLQAVTLDTARLVLATTNGIRSSCN